MLGKYLHLSLSGFSPVKWAHELECGNCLDRGQAKCVVVVAAEGGFSSNNSMEAAMQCSQGPTRPFFTCPHLTMTGNVAGRRPDSFTFVLTTAQVQSPAFTPQYVGL